MRILRFVLLLGAWLAILAPLPVRGEVAPASRATGEADAGSAKVKDPVLADILKAWDRTQQETTTLVANFTERKELKLLAKPVLSKGEFYYQSPNRARWATTGPHVRRSAAASGWREHVTPARRSPPRGRGS